MTPSDVRFSDFLHTENLRCRMAPHERDEILRELVSVLHASTGDFDEDTVVQAILDREEVSPTVIAPGVALPHARLDEVETPLVAIGTSLDGIDFHDPENNLVNLIILVLTPKADPGAYLRLVAALSRELNAPNAVKRLAMCETAEELLELLKTGTDQLPAHLSAADVMIPHPVTIQEGDTLADAINTFCRSSVYDIPVVDETGDIRGIIAVEDLLRISLPEHLLWMEDLSPILNFQPFAELLKKDRETKIADFMREDFISISPDTPAIQLAKMFLRHNVRQIQVLEGRRLLGVVNVHSFMSQLFWE